MNGARWMVVGLLLLGAGGCTTARVGLGAPVGLPRPLWIEQPKSDDSLYLYRVGFSSQRATGDHAKNAAYENALAEISKSIISSVTVDGNSTRLRSSLVIRNAEILPGCEYYERGLGGHSCWLQVSYPLAEKAKLLKRIEQGDALAKVWGKARSEFNRGAYEQAKPLLLQVIGGHEVDMNLGFSVEQAKLLLGDACREQKDILEARRWYENVAKLSEQDRFKREASERLQDLPAAPRFWPMNDRFGGQKVAILACAREGQACTRSSSLSSVLRDDCRLAQLSSVDVGKRLTDAQRAAFFDDGESGAVVAAAKGAGVLLAVLIDVDPAKRGTKQIVFGQETDAIDTRVHYRVLGLPAGRSLLEGSFKAVAGKTSPDGLAKRSATVLIRNYLIPKCPAVTTPAP